MAPKKKELQQSAFSRRRNTFRLPKKAFLFGAILLTATVSVGAFAQTARADERPVCDGIVSCIQSFGQGLWATIVRTPPQKTSATAVEQIDATKEATYGNKHPLVLQPKEGDFVGIGVDNPQAKLQISGGSDHDLKDAPPGIYIDEHKRKKVDEDVKDGEDPYTYWPRIVLRGEKTTPFIEFWSTGWERKDDKGESIADPHATLLFDPLLNGLSIPNGGFSVGTDLVAGLRLQVGVTSTDISSSPIIAALGLRPDAAPQPLVKVQSQEGGTAALDIGDGYNGRFWRIAVDNDSHDAAKYEQGRMRIQPILNTDATKPVAGNAEGWDTGLTILQNGYVGINNQKPQTALDVQGDAYVSEDLMVQGSIRAVEGDVIVGNKSVSLGTNQQVAFATDRIGLDVAEIYRTREDVEVGDILVAGSDERVLQKSSQQYEGAIIGVVSGAPALLFEGAELKIGAKPNRFTKGSRPPVALAGRVPVKVSLENGPIRVGDYLTSSSKPGVAMRATAPGMALGVALENYSGGGDGKVLAFINIGEKNVAEKLKTLEKEIEDLKKRIKK